MNARVDMGDMVGPAHSSGHHPEEHSSLERMGTQAVAAHACSGAVSMKDIAAGIRQTRG